MTTEKLHPLDAPPGIEAGNDATEVLRAWIVDGSPHVSMRAAFDDPGIWGLLLVDLARHASRMHAQEGRGTEHEAMDRIRTMWNAEIAAPTDLGKTEPRHG